MTVDEAGRFKSPKVAAGTYTIAVTHYLPTPDAAATKGPVKVGTGPPKQFNYLDLWTVPGGPFTLDLTKLKPKK